MAFCGKCGAELKEGTSFCGSCGAPIGASAAGSSSAAGAPATMTSNVAGMLAYILGFVTGIIFLVLEPYKNDKFVRFHAFQSIFYCAVLVALDIAWWTLSSMFLAVSLGILWPIVSLIWLLIRLAFFAGWLFLMYKAYNNERFMLPIIGPLAEKQAG